ncbi:helicase associated domain-containing protein [Streptomyces kaempferi]
MRELLADEDDQAGQTEVLPGVTVHGMDIGKWLARQRKPAVWAALTDGQRERLERLSITPLPRSRKQPSSRPRRP